MQTQPDSPLRAALVPHAAAGAPVRELAEGDILLHEGEAGEHAYFIKTGYLEAFTTIGDMDVVLATLGPGELVGEMAILFNQPRNASVRAVTPCELAVLDKDVVLKGYDEAPQNLKTIIRNMADRIRKANARVVAAATGEDRAESRAESRDENRPGS